MPRSAWKGPYVSVNLLRDVITLARKYPEWWNKARFQGMKAPEIINTHARSSMILPDFMGVKFGVHIGNAYTQIEVVEAMVGHRLGEFAPTVKPPIHKKKEKQAAKKGAKK